MNKPGSGSACMQPCAAAAARAAGRQAAIEVAALLTVEVEALVMTSQVSIVALRQGAVPGPPQAPSAAAAWLADLPKMPALPLSGFCEADASPVHGKASTLQ